MSEDKEVQKDRFGLRHLTDEQEVAISFALFILGTVFILSNLIPIMEHTDITLGLLGLVTVTTSYFFMVESVRELEKKDHFLSRKIEEWAER
jgi:hypothetical protein